jgi:hypothetical protein
VGAFQELLGRASLLRTRNNITVNNKRKLVSDKAGRGRQVEIDCNLEMEASTGSDRENDHGIPAYGGWVYHMGTHSLGYQYFHARYLVIRGKYVTMFKRDPVEHPRAVPIRKGVVSHHLMVEDVGRKVYHGRALYVLKIYSRLDHSRQGEFACTSGDEVEKWMSAFQHAKEQVTL